MLKDFYWKVTYGNIRFPSVAYGIATWGISYNNTKLEALGKMQIRATRIIYGLNWDMPAQEVVMNTGWTHYKARTIQLAHKCYYGQAPDQ